MIDIKFLRENPDAVRENIKKKFQDSKLPLVDCISREMGSVTSRSTSDGSAPG